MISGIYSGFGLGGGIIIMPLYIILGCSPI